MGKDKDEDKRAQGDETRATGDKKRAKDGKRRKQDAQLAGVSVAAHPRAAAAVRRAKGLGGIGAFALAAYLSYRAGASAEQVGLRALLFGLLGYMVAWACALAVSRHLVLAELRAAVESRRARLEPAAVVLGPPPAAADPATPDPARAAGGGA